MLVFNIIKPDMLKHDESLSFYHNHINSIIGSDNIEYYEINNWTELSKRIYELEVNKQEEEILKEQRRKELLTTILGYNIYYPENKAMLALYDINGFALEKLYELEMLKKEIRKRFVYNTDKYFLKTKSDYLINFSEKLNEIDQSLVSADVIVIPNEQDVNDTSYLLIHFNKIHLPDIDISSIYEELQILKEQEIISSKNLVKKLRR